MTIPTAFACSRSRALPTTKRRRVRATTAKYAAGRAHRSLVLPRGEAGEILNPAVDNPIPKRNSTGAQCVAPASVDARGIRVITCSDTTTAGCRSENQTLALQLRERPLDDAWSRFFRIIRAEAPAR